MTLKSLYRNWQDYEIEVTYLKITKKRIILKDVFIACVFLPKEHWLEDALDFDTGLPVPGMNHWEGTKMFRMKTDENDLCYLWNSQEWVKIGKFVKSPRTTSK